MAHPLLSTAPVAVRCLPESFIQAGETNGDLMSWANACKSPAGWKAGRNEASALRGFLAPPRLSILTRNEGFRALQLLIPNGDNKL